MDADNFDRIILDAIAEEIAARDFYLGVAQRMQDANVRAIFEDLARDEAHHRDLLETFRFNPLARVEFKRAQDFRVAEKEQVPVFSFDMSPKEAFQLAMKKEELAMITYRELAAACKDFEGRRLYLQLAEMEKGHKSRLEELFVNSAYPEAW